MRFIHNESAPWITINLGGELGEVEIAARYLTATERMQAVRLLAVNVADCMAYCLKLVYGWKGIVDKGGVPIPADSGYRLPGSNEESSAVEVIVGRWPLAKQIELWACILTMNGIKHENIRLILAEFVDAATVERVMEGSSRFLSSQMTAPETSSSSG